MTDLIGRLRAEIDHDVNEPLDRLLDDAATEIERLGNRIAVLEMVISDELYPTDCCDDANAMIVENILERRRL